MIAAVGLVMWSAGMGPSPPGLQSMSPGWLAVVEARGAGQPGDTPKGQDLADLPAAGERPSDLELERWSRAAAALAAGFGLLALVFLVGALISRRIRRRRRIRRHSVYGVELPRSRISG